MAKVCANKKCEFNGVPQPNDNFYHSQLNEGGLATHCKSSMKIRQKKHADKVKESRDFYKGFTSIY